MYRLDTMRTTALILSVLIVTACGGGGSSGSSRAAPLPTPAPAPTPPPVPPPADTYTVVGAGVASSSQALDGDTNDPSNRFLPNDTVTSAQVVNNPVTLGGYVNLPGTGAAGRSQTTGDPEDYFRVELLEGQTITMLVADFQSADADLYLYNPAGDVIDFSIEVGEVESLVVPDDGEYIINVSAFADATNYILAIGSQAIAADFSRQHYIEPWQLVVRYRDEKRRASADELFDLEARGGGPGRPRLMALRKRLKPQPIRFGAAMAKQAHFSNEELQARFETLMTIKALGQRPDIALVEPNYRMRSFLAPDDEALAVQWHYPLIDLPAAWDTTAGSSSVVVAVIDTGILSGHPDLAGQLVAGYDFVRDPSSAGDGDGIDPNPEDLGYLETPGPSLYHGTHVAGTIAAAGDNLIGGAGVAYGVRVMPLRVLGDGGAGTGYDVSQGIRYAAGLPNDSGRVPTQPADIINLSLGGGPFSQAQQQLFDEVLAQGVVVVAAAGNEATSTPQYPASYQGVLSVSAIDINRQITGYSNRGPQITLAAPGGNNSTDVNGDGYPDGVLSTGGVGGPNPEFAYTFLSGTSMAAPHVAGVIALMRSLNPDLSPDDIAALIISGALTDDAGLPGRDDNYGHGIINAYKSTLAALESLGSDPQDSPRLTLSANSLSFGSSDLPIELTLGNAGQGLLSVNSVSSGAPWLDVVPNEIDANGLGVYRVSVTRGELQDGVYSANITIDSTANSGTVRVFMAVGNNGIEADVGSVYVLLYDAITEETIAQVSSTAESGRYSFRFSNIPAGNYQLIAGSDADNDQFICDAGEACGAWLTLDQPITFTIDSDRSDLEFPVEYQVFLPDLSPASVSTAVPVATPRRAGIKPYPLRPGIPASLR